MMTETGDDVVVDHAGGLHMRVADGGANKFETAFEQVFAHGIGLVSPGWNFTN